MNLKEIVRIALHSELGNLGYSGKEEIVTDFINLGLIELYDIFSLRTGEWIIPLEDGKDIYDLPEDFLSLVSAFEATESGVALPLQINVEGDPRSLNTINYFQVQLPEAITGAYVSVMYIQKPPHLSYDRPEDKIPLPSQLIQPLLNFVAFKGQGVISVEGQSDSDVYYMRFKRSCDEVKARGTGIAPDDITAYGNLRRHGFP